MSSLRIAVLTALALLAFAGNSLLCRAALAHTRIDAASFTTVRLVSGALRSCCALPTPQCEIFLGLLGAQASVPASQATAYPHRDALYVMNVHTRWDDALNDARCIAWARDFFRDAAPCASGGVYVNFMPQDESERTSDAYGANYQRLAQIKAQYDPDNLFRANQNIRPALAAVACPRQPIAPGFPVIRPS